MPLKKHRTRGAKSKKLSARTTKGRLKTIPAHQLIHPYHASPVPLTSHQLKTESAHPFLKGYAPQTFPNHSPTIPFTNTHQPRRDSFSYTPLESKSEG
jgi:hypothetical protein